MKQNLVSRVSRLRDMLSCKMCQRITLSVFFAILLVEAVILFFSVDNYERDRLLEIEREALVVTRAIFRASDPNIDFPKNFPSLAAKLRDRSVLIGARVYDVRGKEVTSFGKLPALAVNANSLPKITQRRRSDDGTTYDVIWSKGRVDDKYFVAVRLDSNQISTQITAFIWRITGLVLLISTFVTLTTMLTVGRSLLLPIRQLRKQLLRAAADPLNPKAYLMAEDRNDEFGDVVHAFNKNLDRIDENLQENRRQERELVKHRDQLEHQVLLRTKKLEQALKVAEAANKAKSAFLSNMNHELRTPLNAMIGFSDLMVQEVYGPLGNEDYREYSTHIYDSSVRLLNLINALLDVAMLDSGNLILKEKEFDIADAVRSVLKQAEKEANEKGLHLVFHADEYPHILSGDEKRVRQILNNLLSNALKFSRATDYIRLSLFEEEGGGLSIQVRDTGMGIKEKDLKNVMERFTQGEDSYARAHEGAGLGLTVAHQLALLHDAAFTIESELDSGTVVTITFPADRHVRCETAQQQVAQNF